MTVGKNQHYHLLSARAPAITKRAGNAAINSAPALTKNAFEERYMALIPDTGGFRLLQVAGGAL